MSLKLKKYGILSVAAVLLVAMAFAGTAGAVSITAEEWNNLTTSEQINGNASYEFTGTGIIEPKFTGSASSKYVPNQSMTFDFTDFRGTFAGVPAGTKSYQGALFGNIRNTTGAFAITIVNLTLTDVTVNSTGSHIGGIVGYLAGASKGDVTLNLTGCSLVNCTIAAARGSPAGGLFGNLQFQAKGNVTLNITDCHLVDTAITGAGGQAGGLFGIFKYPGSSFGPLASGENSTSFPPQPPAATTSGTVNLESCSARHCSINGQGGVGSLIGYCTSGGYVITAADCAVDNCVLSGTSRMGGIAGDIGSGSVRFARCTVENTSIVIADQKLGAKLGGLLGGDDTSSVKAITDCTVKNCLLVSSTKLPNQKGYGGLVGGAKSVTGVTNSTVVNCTVIGSSQAGGLIGGVLSAPSGCSGNTLQNSAVKGNMSTQLDCGAYPGTLGCTVSGSYLNTNDTALAEPQIVAVTPGETPSGPLPAGATVVTQMTGIGTAADPQSAAGYIIDKAALVFNACNGSAVPEYGSVSLGDTALVFNEPVYTGYTFNSWNLSSAEGIMIADSTGALQPNVAGYTNASGVWINASGTAVDLYANWTLCTAQAAADANGTAVFGNTNVTAVHSTAGNRISSILLADVGNLPAGTAVEFTADNTTVPGIPDLTGRDRTELAVFEINATVSSGTTAWFTLTVVFSDEATAAETMHDMRIWHYNASAGAWDAQPLEYTLTRTNETVTYTVSTASFSPFGMGIYTEIPPQYTPSSPSKQTGSTIILSEGQTAPTAYATAAPTAAPTVKPTEQPATPTAVATAKPTTQPTPSSPAPVVGLLAGLGAAALVLARLRK